MGENIVGLFLNEDDAQAAFNDLRSGGFSEHQVSWIAKNPQAAAHAIARREVQAESMTQDDAAVEVPREQRAATRPDGIYLIVRAHSKDQARRALDVMQRYNVADVEHREQEYHEGDWAPSDETPAGADTTQMQSRGS